MYLQHNGLPFLRPEHRVLVHCDSGMCRNQNFDSTFWAFLAPLGRSLWSGHHWKDLFVLQKVSIDDANFGQKRWRQKRKKGQGSSRWLRAAQASMGLCQLKKKHISCAIFFSCLPFWLIIKWPVVNLRPFVISQVHIVDYLYLFKYSYAIISSSRYYGISHMWPDQKKKEIQIAKLISFYMIQFCAICEQFLNSRWLRYLPVNIVNCSVVITWQHTNSLPLWVTSICGHTYSTWHKILWHCFLDYWKNNKPCFGYRTTKKG